MSAEKVKCRTLTESGPGCYLQGLDKLQFVIEHQVGCLRTNNWAIFKRTSLIYFSHRVMVELPFCDPHCLPLWPVQLPRVNITISTQVFCCLFR